MANQSALNPEQQSVVHAAASRVVVPAGPGSGKSRTVVARILRRIENGVHPSKIIALSFTNGAGHILAERLGPITLRYIGTRHGLMFRIIQSHGGLIGYRAGSVSIVTEDVEKELLAETKKRLGSKISDRALHLMANKNSDANLIWNEYRHTLKRQNMCSYDQILVDGLALLKKDAVREAMAVSDYLCDEAQDNSEVDWLIDEAFPADSKMWVGDDSQAIYGFRGAQPVLFVVAAEKFETHTLSTNYRSDVAICVAANKLIYHNKRRVDKLTVPRKGAADGFFGTLECPDAGLELMAVFAGIRKQMENFGTPPNEIAVLARTNALADNMRNCLRGLCVPVKFTGSVQLPEDWRFALSCVSLLVDPANDYHAERVMKGQGIHQLGINQAKLLALRDGVSLSTAAKVPNLGTGLETLYARLIVMGVSHESVEIIDGRIKVLPNENPTLSDLLSDLWNHEKWNPQDASDGVFVGTVHSAKGREFDAVYVIGCEEGIFPSLRVDDDIEEHRRLMFVAITRARHSLVCSWARTRTNYGKTTTQIPSRFLEEMR